MRRLRNLGTVLTVTVVTAFAALAGPAAGSGSGSAGDPIPGVDDFRGIVALGNCSASLVRFAGSTPTQRAMMLTNGHCLESGMPAAGVVIVDTPAARAVTLLNPKAEKLATLKTDRIIYATMTDTDVALYRMEDTYADIRSRYKIDALPVAAAGPAAGDLVTVASGYWKQLFKCGIDGPVHEVHEAGWIWKNSLRYGKGGGNCYIMPGTSGSPVLDNRTGAVVAINNTVNEKGERCTLNNPCEVDAAGQVTVRQGRGYAQQTATMTTCVNPEGQLDLSRTGCALPRPPTR